MRTGGSLRTLRVLHPSEETEEQRQWHWYHINQGTTRCKPREYQGALKQKYANVQNILTLIAIQRMVKVHQTSHRAYTIQNVSALVVIQMRYKVHQTQGV